MNTCDKIFLLIVIITVLICVPMAILTSNKNNQEEIQKSEKVKKDTNENIFIDPLVVEWGLGLSGGLD